MKKTPYGKSDYKQIIMDNNVYVDKTHFIEILENNTNYALFLRL